ncbi:uncharacterized protein EI90DRAFT_3289050, partial [Cantharellus anzutake]|uniref:uncharacterized protein n=1 Tax=Cantharellus anzutake TaxID=1750568 RepID=UPI001906CDF4
MADLYSFVDAVDELKNKIQLLEASIIRISVQTTECGIFIKQPTRSPNILKHLPNNLEPLGGADKDLHMGVTSYSAFISVQISRGVEKLVEIEALKPATMDAGDRDTCLPGTRVDILKNLIDSLTDPSLPPGHNVIWLRGPAGSGKSTILNTVAQHFSELRRRGAFLFWDRNDPLDGEPLCVIRTLAFQLARFNPSFAVKMAEQIEKLPDITTSALDMQFKHLLEAPLAELAAELDLGPIVIVLDALDECGTMETRTKLLRALSEGLARLPSTFRFLIASRDEPDIGAALSRLGVDVRDVPIGDESTSSDIKLLFQQRLTCSADAFVGHGLSSNWPGDPVIRQLVALSRGLFIWASTTIRFLESGFPEERLKKVLSASVQAPSHAGLDNLYRVALTHPFDSYDENKLKAVHSILGAIVVAREQLTDWQLSQLLGLELGKVQVVLSRLQSLLQGGRGRPVQVLHTSFTDFLCDSKRCQDPQWHINTPVHHLDLASGCLQVMKRDLKFNICGIETSYYRNREIEGIQQRIDRAITPALTYASEYWADHLGFGSMSEPGPHPLVDAVMNFINRQFLYWIEVFSVKDRMFMIPSILRKAASWAK